MLIGIQNEILKLHSLKLLDMLLSDKTTKANILWATDAYADLGDAYGRDKEITPPLITAENSGVIKNRARKALEQQTERTRRHAEVFTPLWICRKMNDHADETWFERPGAFFDADGKPTERVIFPKSRRKRPEWQRYVDSRRLEITCGEAPYLVSRYDVSTGEYIEIEDRIGILDRKLRVINENAADEKEWLKWAMRAFRTTYGYEFQGDNLLIARVNLLMTFEEYLQERWNRKPTPKEYQTVANIIAWNIWQMDGLTGTIPYCKAEEEFRQISLFDLFAMDDVAEPHEQKGTQPRCRIYDWLGHKILDYLDVNTGGRNMKFDYVIGNPPYQEDTKTQQAKPVYHLFVDEAEKLASDGIVMIIPSRWFAGGMGLDSFRIKMLNDTHICELIDFSNAKDCFPNTSISGGVCIFSRMENHKGDCLVTNVEGKKTSSMRRSLNEFPILVRYNSAVSVIRKVVAMKEPLLQDLVSSISPFGLATNVRGVALKTEEKNILLYTSKGTSYISQQDITKSDADLESYKVLVSQTSAEHAGEPSKDGMFRVLTSSMTVMKPNEACTHSYIYISPFSCEKEAQNVLKYLKTRFTRFLILQALTSIHISKSTFLFVPLQDFTQSSDIDWSQSVANIDQQLYRKYNLSPEEIDFIETHVKEME